MSAGHQLLKFPIESISLTPELWLALGIASYNHALLAQCPLPILSPKAAEGLLEKAKLQAIAEGRAALTDATQLSPSSLAAAVRITRTLLEPLGVNVTIIATPEEKTLMLLEFRDEAMQRHPPLSMQASAEDTSDGETVRQRAGRILPAYNYPASAADDAGTTAHQAAGHEALQPEPVATAGKP